MNNEQIIASTAIAAGLYSENDVKRIIEESGELPLHSMLGWKHRSPKGFEYRVKKGEHGLECRLWQKRKKKDDDKSSEKPASDNDEASRNFYLAKTYLFDESHVEMIKLEV